MKTPRRGIRMRFSEGVRGHTAQRRVGFTLVEMMVTLVIMMLLFGIIFVPLNQAFNFFQLGQTRTNMQQAARQTLEQISTDLRTAVRVFPNDITPGITNQPPYNVGGSNVGPYINGDSCSDDRISNLSRIDFIPARLDPSGSVITPVRPARYLVTYYGRRLTVIPADDDRSRYDAITNPVILFRAQSPIYDGDDAPAEEPNSSARNVDTSSDRYGSECNNRGSSWLMQERGEPNFETPLGGGNGPIVSDSKDDEVFGSHTRAIPLGVSLTAPLAGLPATDPNLNYAPLTTFTIIDSNDDGKLDQVKINLGLESYNTSGTSNGSGEQPAAQRVRMSTTVDLPNVM